MSKSHWQIRPTAVRRLIGAAQSMGLTVSGIEISQGIIRVLVAEPQAPSLSAAAAVSSRNPDGLSPKRFPTSDRRKRTRPSISLSRPARSATRGSSGLRVDEGDKA
jgi:hypothetical protein